MTNITDKRAFGPNEFRFGGVKCSKHTVNELVQEVRILLDDKSLQPRAITCLNAHIYNMAHKMPELRGSIDSARLVAADGMSVVWFAKLFGGRLKERCNMTEAFRSFLADTQMPRSKGILLGGSTEEAQKAAEFIARTSSHCEIIEAVSGFLDDNAYEGMVAGKGDPDFIFIGMGTPKSERLMTKLSAISPSAICWHIGGGTIQYLAGTRGEAGPFIRRWGLQWIHRLFQDPAGMWKRYILGLPLFLVYVLGDWVVSKVGHARK